jgi:DNA-binding MarR family transcriptional regulator
MTSNGLRALTEAKAAEMITLYNTGKYSQRELAKQFGVSQGTISNIVSCRLYVGVQNVRIKPVETLIS